MRIKEPIFVCGLARTGTSWIARSLGQSSELNYIGEANFINKINELTEWFCSLDKKKRPYLTWTRNNINRQIFIKHLQRFYRDLLFEASGIGSRFVEKSPNMNLENIELLNELFPRSYFILICRDGRNQVASFEKKWFKSDTKSNFIKSCEKWKNAMDILKNVEEKKFIQKYKIIRYEDMLTSFDKIFKEICEFVEINHFEPVPVKPNSSFENINQISDFTNRWKDWPNRKKSIFKRIAGSRLIEWGYVESDEPW